MPMSSIYGLKSSDAGHAAYCASKFGVIELSKTVLSVLTIRSIFSISRRSAINAIRRRLSAARLVACDQSAFLQKYQSEHS